mmetsp:Transcript_24196/g.67901  ORF Transcript_24196/g.67901 Transcript_24196/m.67901 type:complete len:113 (-) Transcript_24196:385-723(-)
MILRDDYTFSIDYTQASSAAPAFSTASGGAAASPTVPGTGSSVIARRALQAQFHGERNLAIEGIIVYLDGGVRREIDVVQCPFQTDDSIGCADGGIKLSFDKELSIGARDVK